jgi:zinc and cadmium transporter
VSPAASLTLYAIAILLGALVGGALPLLGGRRRSDGMLSFSAGVMLGAAFFHMLPEATEAAGLRAIPWVLVGFLFLYLLERYVLVHVCAEPGLAGWVHGHDHGAAELDAHGHAGTGCEVHTLGLAAFVGLSLHTLVDGFALGAASGEERLGLLVFIAILAHKVPSSFSLSAILRAEGYSRARALAMNALFALMVPLGALLYVAAREVVHTESFTAFALAASAGTFLHLALSDILPDLHRRADSRLRLSGLLLVGVATMWGLRLVHAH